MYRIILSRDPDALLAAKPEVTIEAEYGSRVVEGSLYTSAHHQRDGKYESKVHPAPCNDRNIPHAPDALIGVSHIDLDTLGGIARVVGHDAVWVDGFWRAAEIVDVNGPHRMEDLVDVRYHAQLQAFWAWSAENRLGRSDEDVTDVTEYVYQSLAILGKILDEDECLLQAGANWVAQMNRQEEETFVGEIQGVLIRSGNAFNNALYRHDGKAYAAVVSFSPKTGSVTVSFAQPKPGQSARDIVQSVWSQTDGDGNPLAGGHNGIAGNPRGVRATFAEWYAAIKATGKVLEG